MFVRPGRRRLLELRLEIDIVGTPPKSDVLSGYDQRHLVIYRRLLDAKADGADWREVASKMLGLDVDADPEVTHRVWRHTSKAPHG